MFKLIIFVYVAFMLNLFSVVHNKTLSIDLLRQKSPRESALNTRNIEQHGLYLDWLKPHPHPHNFSNISIALRKFLDNEFYGTLKLGSKNVSFNVVFDTAWSTSWIMSKSCPTTSIGCWLHNKYDHYRSDSYVEDGRSYFVNEGSYNLSGFYSIDNINVGGAKITNFSFVEMTTVPYVYVFTKADGVMGLSMSYGSQKTFLMRLIEAGTIKKPMFSLYLNRDRTSIRGGLLLLGAYDMKHVHVDPVTRVPEKIVYFPVDDNNSGFWQFKMNAVAVYEKKKSFPICLTGCKAFVDSSSNAIVASKAEIMKINKFIKAKAFAFGRFSVSCDTVHRLPKINFIINGNNFTIEGRDYIQKIAYSEYQVCLSAFMVADAPSEKNWVLGGAFLSHFYSIYDLKKRQIGFVRAA